MPNLLRMNQLGDKVHDYKFLNEYKDDKDTKVLKDTSEDISEEVLDFEVVNNNEEESVLDSQVENETELLNDNQYEHEKRERILDEARREANEYLEKARLEAEKLYKDKSEMGYSVGFEKGKREGFEAGYKESKETVGRESERFFEELNNYLKEVSYKKDEIIEAYRKELRDVAIAIAEKVILVSLKSSGDIIERMIISATERLRAKEWAKIYICKIDAEKIVGGDKSLIAALSNITSNVKIIAMENEKPGTCIIEFPDEIIDASVNTQIENIKEILKSSGN